MKCQTLEFDDTAK